MTLLIDKLKTGGVPHATRVPSLVVEDVSVAYAPGVDQGRGQATAVSGWAIENISFQIEAGQQVAVVGPNGAGKSTLFKLIAGTLKPNQGQITVYGHAPDCHICIAYVPQRNQIDWSFPVTVEDVVMMGRVGQIGLFRWPRRRDWQLVRHSLARVEMDHLAQKQIGELSGGQQQRAFLARALAQRADLLLMDEPFSGLDAPGKERILTILDSLQEDKVTLMVSTHDLELAAERFGQVMLLNRRLIALGPPAECLTTANLLEAFGGHMHQVDGQSGLFVADSCCDP